MTSSDMFNVRRGIGQGRPLVLLLFESIIEYLAELMRIHAQIKGREMVPGINESVALYADDVRAFLSDLE